MRTWEDWTFSLSDELEIPHFQAKVKPMKQTDHGSDLRQLTVEDKGDQFQNYKIFYNYFIIILMWQTMSD